MTESDLHNGDDFADLDDLPQTEAEQLVRRVLDVIETARPVPLSTSAMINKEEVVVLLEQALAHFPREMRESRWLLKERTEFLAKAREEAEEIIARSRTRAERMVQRNEVVREADRRARQIIDAAEADARRMRLEVEDYCDKKLGSFEIVLERTMKLVQQGRERLQIASSRLSEDYPEREADAVAAARAEGMSGFFDQDVP